MVEDAEILRNLSKGDRFAFDTLFRKYHRYLVSIAYSYTKDLEVSRDLSQEVFLDVWKRRDKISIEASFKAFIRRAVINQSMTRLKAEKKYDPLSEKTLKLADNVDLHQDLNYKEIASTIKNSVISLPERCRKIFELSRYEGKSHKEIAASLEISTKTIENQMTKALKKIRFDLKESGLLAIIFCLLRGWGPFMILVINIIDIWS